MTDWSDDPELWPAKYTDWGEVLKARERRAKWLQIREQRGHFAKLVYERLAQTHNWAALRWWERLYNWLENNPARSFHEDEDNWFTALDEPIPGDPGIDVTPLSQKMDELRNRDRAPQGRKKGTKQSEEAKAKIAAGVKAAAERRRAAGITHYRTTTRRPMSDETKAKISATKRSQRPDSD